MAEIEQENEQQNTLDKAVAEGGAYEILRKRLTSLGQELNQKTEALNQQRLSEFGKSDMSIIGRIRIRTENNCIARDIVRFGDWLLFGYNVFLGLKKETKIEDVFSLYQLVERDENYEADPVDLSNTFLNIDRFVQDFNELYTYYKNAQLLQLVERDGKLLASFQIGERVSDIRVFRWSISSDKKTINYIDNRGERDIALPPAYDFEWTETTRENIVNGRFSHVNILDTVFVETIGGDLTIKCENNTNDGLGIYREEVLDKNQSINDAKIEYAKVGALILLKVLPYREDNWRYLIYNTLTQKIQRIDFIGQACIQLPEDHGVIFPGGYYLQNGEYKTFDQSMTGMRFRRIRRSPNGEDVLYIFYDPNSGRLALFNYNMIERKLDNPILGHGYAVFEDGRMVVFEGENDEPTRVHPMQIWQTPFYSDEFAATQPTNNTFLGKIGNAELVRGISDLYFISREIDNQSVSSQLYGKLSEDTKRLFDTYFWLADEKNLSFSPILRNITQTSELVLDEYEKVESIRRQSESAMREAITNQQDLLAKLYPDSWQETQEFVDALNAIKMQLGRLVTLRTYRYINLEQIDKMENELKERQSLVSLATAEFLGSDKALEPFISKIDKIEKYMEQADTVAKLIEPIKNTDEMSNDLDMLSQLMASLKFEDVTLQTRIIESIAEVYAKLNQTKARINQKRKNLSSVEMIAQFGAQFKLFSQSIASALSIATTPEKCDDELSRLLVQLEELENQFSESEEFLNDILTKREEILESFETHKQALLEDRTRRTEALLTAAVRILDSIPRRTAKFSDQNELNAFFVADPLALKIREIVEKLRDLFDNVKADDIESRFKSARDQAIRALRDKSEIFESGGNVIKLGPKHKFSVNTQELDLTIVPKETHLYLQLTGTDYQEKIENSKLESYKPFWTISLESESPTVYRGEYLAYSIINAILKKDLDISYEDLVTQLSQPESLVKTVRDYAAMRYREGYEKGIHDHDAVKILSKLIPLGEAAGLLRYNPLARSLAMLFWQYNQKSDVAKLWPERAKTCKDIQALFGHDEGLINLQAEMATELNQFLQTYPIKHDNFHIKQATEYLSYALAEIPQEFNLSKYSIYMYEGLKSKLEELHMWGDFNQSQLNLKTRLADRWNLIESWYKGLCTLPQYQKLVDYIPEAILLCMLDKENSISIQISELELDITVSDLLGEHPTIKQGVLNINLDDFFSRMRKHARVIIPEFRHYQTLRQEVLDEQRYFLHIDEFKAKPLSSFVRNKLINQVYLPIIGDNLAKQMGTVGESRRTDLMGLLLLISPPGYGKTTLMEYIANRLGLIFMKINGPALGHSVLSFDPEQAPNATARQELEKLNLALEMGNNVMLYVDDIQHTNPEFLQKFISLCDGSRRIEGVWKGKTKTYDLRGKKFCVIMAGNPYTESGEVFKIPDMLANRADIYNLGEVLGGMDEVFASSYIENCLTSNSILSPLALRDLNDLYHLIDHAQGKPLNTNELSYDYSQAEISEIVAVLRHLLKIREVVFKVNQQYIISAAQSDKYRTEPPFKLQGSYRNMNKLTEKISSVMNDEELNQVIEDHYLGEAQLLTNGAEENLLKLAEIRGVLTKEQMERWQQIKNDFMRNKTLGGDESNTGNQIVTQLADLVQSVQALKL
ncbi:DNA repair ATPase [Gilliamella apicola]|uniref:DNA repair ATPase n=1 Tax=Gilliamella apicola TaxID=1196095 RepID=UPI00080DF568|nr:DNA repair ATPase [Gilliamella apicola]OCG12701.1 DNA repair protein [Gilliamella apicola]ORF45351.1 DNA repair protein [Gilliamella apicola]ORF47766.1 DNA repair protein [Gilliamella apicola]ORF51641.1 DNA repair protein [Gilliamella apicola]ORF52985.1 DNA repair protein [Gilliamella apicola]